MTWKGFSAGLKHAVENRIQHWSRKAHAVCSHMTCHSLWKSLCVPEHEDRARCLTSALLLLSFRILQKWVSNASDLRHPQRCYHKGHKYYEATSPRGKIKKEGIFPTVSSLYAQFQIKLLSISAHTTFADIKKASFLICHALDRQ